MPTPSGHHQTVRDAAHRSVRHLTERQGTGTTVGHGGRSRRPSTCLLVPGTPATVRRPGPPARGRVPRHGAPLSPPSWAQQRGREVLRPPVPARGGQAGVRPTLMAGRRSARRCDGPPPRRRRPAWSRCPVCTAAPRLGSRWVRAREDSGAQDGAGPDPGLRPLGHRCGADDTGRTCRARAGRTVDDRDEPAAGSGVAACRSGRTARWAPSRSRNRAGPGSSRRGHHAGGRPARRDVPHRGSRNTAWHSLRRPAAVGSARCTG